MEGRRYLDCLAGYSALNFGHSHPRLVARAREQLGRLTLTSRAFYNDQLGPFARDLAELTGKEMILPMNSGAEAVETAIKVARKWGYRVKGVPEDQATIVAMEGNFHGRTTTIVSFSNDAVATADYGPYTPGFRLVPYGDFAALEAAIDESTVAVLLEPIQGEAGVMIPPAGYLQQVRTLCNAAGVLMMADEIQSGLARTGRTFACDHEEVVPDVYILGKALGGGLYPVSAIAADGDVLGVITPGSHGSTFGGNPLAAAIGREVVAMLQTGELQDRSATLGDRLDAGLGELVGHGHRRRARPRAVGRRRHRPRARHRPARVRAAARPRHPRQGGARPDGPARAAPGRDRGRHRPGRRRLPRHLRGLIRRDGLEPVVRLRNARRDGRLSSRLTRRGTTARRWQITRILTSVAASFAPLGVPMDPSCSACCARGPGRRRPVPPGRGGRRRRRRARLVGPARLHVLRRRDRVHQHDRHPGYADLGHHARQLDQHRGPDLRLPVDDEHPRLRAPRNPTRPPPRPPRRPW